MPSVHFPDFDYKYKKTQKRKENLFFKLRKSDPILIQILIDFFEHRKEKTRTKSSIKKICRKLYKKSIKLDRSYAKRIKDTTSRFFWSSCQHSLI